MRFDKTEMYTDFEALFIYIKRIITYYLWHKLIKTHLKDNIGHTL